MRSTSRSVRSSRSFGSGASMAHPHSAACAPVMQSPVNRQPFGALVAEPVRPQARRRDAPHPRGRITDLGVGGGDHLVGVQRDVGAAGHAVAVDLDHRRLVGVHQAGEPPHEPAHHLVVDHRIPRLIREVVDGLGFTVQHGALIGAAPAGRAGAIGVGAQVEARAETLAAAGDQDDVHVGIEVGALHQRRELQRGVGDDRVAFLRPVEGDPRNPVGDLVGHRFQVAEVDRPDRMSHVAAQPFTRARSRMGARSSPAGMVPNAPPHWRSRRVVRKASATAGCPWRTSSEPCSARQMSSATLRARYWIVSRSVRCVSQPLDVAAQPRVLTRALAPVRRIAPRRIRGELPWRAAYPAR